MTADQLLTLTVFVTIAGLIIWLGGKKARVPAPPVLSPIGEETRAGFSLIDEWQELERTIVTLQNHFSSSLFCQPPLLYPPLSDGNQSAYLKELVRNAAVRYGLTLHKLHVRFTPALDTSICGQIHQRGASVFIDFAEKYRDDDTALAAIVGHEVAHLALWTRNLGRAGGDQDEKLTDAFAALVGYGPVMLSAGYQELGGWKDHQTYVGKVFSQGYLHPRAIAYLTIRQAECARVPDIRSFATKCGLWTQDAYAFIVEQRRPHRSSRAV